MSNISHLVAQLIPQLLGKLPIRQEVAFALAKVTPSATTAVPLAGGANIANGRIARRKGSLTGISAELSASHATESVVVQLVVNGAQVAGATATIAPTTTTARATFPAFTYQYAAGDKITCQAVAGAIVGNEDLDVSLELTE